MPISGRKKALKIVSVQTFFSLIVCCIVWWVSDLSSFASSIAGSLAGIIPALLQALVLFNHVGARSAAKIIKAFYLSEVLKLFFTAALFAAAFLWGEVAVLPLFVGFIAAQIGFWLAPLVLSV